MSAPLALGALMSAAPLALLLVSPAVAADPGYGQVSLTAVLAGVRTGGVVGASGGLATLDTGSAYLNGRLDSSPSSRVLAAPYEPGTLVRTGVGQVNGAAGSALLAVPDAEAGYPGSSGSATCCQIQAVDSSPLHFGAGRASAQAGAMTAAGSATGGALDVGGVVVTGASTSTLTMSASALAGRSSQTARTAVGRLVVAGLLTLSDVVAEASISSDGTAHRAMQALTVGGASVNGQTVEIGNDGVTAVGTPLIPGMTLETATSTANTELAAAGVTVHSVKGTTALDERSARASTGGVAIHLVTADLPGGVAANALDVTVGGIELSEQDAPPVAAPPAVVAQPPVSRPGTSTTRTTVVPGTPAVPATAALPAPAVVAPASPSLVRTTTVVLAGRQVSDRTAIAAFAGWQMLSLGCATLYAFVERRRRLILMGRSA